jgi:transcriptional regulator of arginine metabolism
MSGKRGPLILSLSKDSEAGPSPLTCFPFRPCLAVAKRKRALAFTQEMNYYSNDYEFLFYGGLMADPKARQRLKALQELIKTNAIADQQTLVQMMSDTYGIETNQSIVSRDLRKLGVSKKAVGAALVYELPSIDASAEILKLGVIDVAHNEMLIIIKTMPGLADFVADFLDLQEELGILGTLAGENMVFVAPESVKKIGDVYEKVCRVLHVKK